MCAPRGCRSGVMGAVAVLCIPSSAIVSLTKAFRAVLGMHRQAVNLVGVLFSLRYIVIEFRAMVRCAVDICL